MYRCEDCGRFFEEPVVVHDDPSASGVSLPSGYYIEWYCPHCGGDKVEEAGSCVCDVGGVRWLKAKRKAEPRLLLILSKKSITRYGNKCNEKLVFVRCWTSCIGTERLRTTKHLSF